MGWYLIGCFLCLQQSTRKELLKAQVELRELKTSKVKAEEALNSVRKQLEAKELVSGRGVARVPGTMC